MGGTKSGIMCGVKAGSSGVIEGGLRVDLVAE